VAIAFDASDPAALASFWGEMLGRQVRPEDRGALLPGDDTQVGLRFVASDAEKAGLNRLHLHLTSTSAEDMQQTIDGALQRGARHIDVGQLPEEGHVVLADPGDNEFCVIPPDNTFLAGTGFLGEVACDGTRDVGLFWREALDWALVWDENEETAIQSPYGGTKVAWGGPPVEPKHGRNPQRFDLAAPDVDAEVERLVALGATRLGDRDGGVELADPDGNEFSLTRDAG
jgi:Glyoxalase-like domain